MSDQRHGGEAGPVSPAVSLREACVKRGLDRGGARCPECPLRDPCQSEMRWLIKFNPERCHRC